MTTRFPSRKLSVLKVAPMLAIICLGKKETLSPRFIRPFEIIEHIGKIAYKFALPGTSLHNIFYVSMLKKNVLDSSHVLVYRLIQVHEDLK